MDNRNDLLGRRAIVHYSYMIASLIFLAGCAATDNAGPTESEMATLAAAGEHYGSKYLEDIIVSPARVSLQPGAIQRFTATKELTDGRSISGHFRWSATGGSIDKNGSYTASREPGVYRVIVSSRYVNVADTAVVTVAAVTLEPGTAQQFAVSGKLSDGTTTVPSVRWTATGGTISSDGRYTAGGTAGTYRAVATHESNLADTATITIGGTTPEPPLSVAGCPGR